MPATQFLPKFDYEVRFPKISFYKSLTRSSLFLLRSDLAGKLGIDTVSSWLVGGDQSGAGDLSPFLGRGEVRTFEIEGGPTILVRNYRRGGFPRHFVSNSFFHWPHSSLSTARPAEELRVLSILFGSGIAIPTPVAAYLERSCCGFAYRALIATEYCAGATNLLDLTQASVDQERLSQLAYKVGKEVQSTLEAGICHTDLHLGNVLVDPSDGIVLIDFDKAVMFEDPNQRERYRKRLIARWSRSVHKHGASPQLVSNFISGLFGEVKV